MRKIYISAFTLSEVLITFGIIGIIAAMTLPALTGKYQQKVLASQFKKAYANLQTAINTVNSENGIPYECYTIRYGIDYHVTECKDFWENVLKQYQIVNTCEHNKLHCRPVYKTKAQVLAEGGTVINNACSHPINEQTGYNLNDGSILYIYNYPNYNHNSLFFGLDVNGLKGPNKWGYDLFYLNLYRENIRTPVVGLTFVCELIEKGGQSAEEIMLK
ncbi:TPA: hypothetical protein IAC10_04150 [Candidatus Scatousia excrementigallinarum]|uniref:Uncharacterized protein n=1 Tax=Candidatus Scatousia excrementigallinarum TaxID=2840935 RepID=A0A9D1EYF6_9BACT|nr:hypothetical protein [Candidatus Scatousia excrementigallinarum]